MTIDPGRRTAIITALTALNSAGLLQDPVQRDALAGAVIIADGAQMTPALQSDTLEQVLKELDHLLPSESFVSAGTRTVRGWPLATVQGVL